MKENIEIKQSEIAIYTDGSCKGNPGPGGYAGLILHKDGSEEVIKGSSLDTTNNRMELKAVIETLKVLKKSTEVVLYSDSEYCIKAINERLSKWIKNNWKGSNKNRVKNIDLWQEYLEVSNIHTIKGIWIKAHSGDEYNELVDSIAKEEALKIKG